MEQALFGGNPGNANLPAAAGGLRDARRGREYGVPGLGDRVNLLPVAGA